MAFVCKKLATDATLNQILCICSGRRPIKTCMEGFADKCLSSSAVRAESGMDFSQELTPFLFGDASLEHSGRTRLIEFSLMYFVGLGTPHNTTSFVLVLGELLPI